MKSSTDKSLGNIQLSLDAIFCKDINCEDEKHRRDICSMYSDIVHSLYEGSKPYYKHKNKNHNNKPGWKEYVSGYHTEARKATKSWAIAGRPRQGPVFEYKKLTNARYKYAIRFICKNEQAMRADSMAKKLIGSNVNDFWKEVRVLNNCKTSLPCTVEGISGPEEIAEVWRQHYSTLFNCIHTDLYKVEHIESNTLLESMVIMSHEVHQAIHKLSNNKASGLDGISAEHLKNASIRIAPLLAICFTVFMIHGVLPDLMLAVLLVTVIKDKAGKIGSLDNYRPIALASILSKVLEKILLDRLNEFINTTDNQFGFKAKHGTDLCIYALKEIVNKYGDKNSSVLMCFIDASKAFDRINHDKLFNKLRQRGVPKYIVRI